jgi:hypothetical protein
MEFYHHLTIFEEEIYGKNYLDLKEANYKYSVCEEFHVDL